MLLQEDSCKRLTGLAPKLILTAGLLFVPGMPQLQQGITKAQMRAKDHTPEELLSCFGQLPSCTCGALANGGREISLIARLEAPNVSLVIVGLSMRSHIVNDVLRQRPAKHGVVRDHLGLLNPGTSD